MKNTTCLLCQHRYECWGEEAPDILRDSCPEFRLSKLETLPIDNKESDAT